MTILEGLLLLHMFLNSPHAASAEESNPCYNYTVLNDDWRATSNLDQSNLRCDVNIQWQGWYRMFYQGLSVRMPEECVPMKRCSTHVPLWLTGPHPSPEDGIVTIGLCGHWDSNCCSFRPPSIRVKACFENYTVYELVSPVSCTLGYCADVSTVIFPTTQAPTTSNVSSAALQTTQAPTTPPLQTTQAPTTTPPQMYFQQRVRLNVASIRELSVHEMTQLLPQIREKLVQMGYPDDIIIRML